MRRGRILILLAFVLIFGALALYLLLGSFGESTDVPTIDGTPMPDVGRDEALIVMAGQDIRRGSVITPEDVSLEAFPTDMITETMVTDVLQVVDRIARMDIDRGLPITSNMITDQPGDLLAMGSEASLGIPPGYTAIAIPMNRLSGVAYALRDGDRVDVLISILIINLDDRFQTALPNLAGVLVSSGSPVGSPPVYLTASNNIETSELGRVETEPVTGQLLYVIPQGIQRPRLVTQRLIENATVLHVGTFPLESQAPGTAPEEAQGVGAPAGQEVGDAPPVPPDVVTLIVTPQDALALNWALKSRADLMFTLRGPGDMTPTETTSVTLQYLLDNYSISIPTSLPYGPEPAVLLPTNPALPNDADAE